MEIWDAFSYPFRLKRNRLTIILGMLLLFIPAIGLIAWSGYLLRVMHAVIHGNENELPEFDIGGDFLRGVGIVLFNFVYLIPVLVLSFVIGLVLGFVFGQRAESYLNLVLIFIYIFNIYSLLAFYIGRLHAATNDDLGALWSLQYHFGKVPRNFMRMLLVGLLQFLLSLCFLLVVLNMQSFIIWLAYLLPNVSIIGIVFFGLFPISLAYVLMSLQSTHLDAQLAAIIEFNDQ